MDPHVGGEGFEFPYYKEAVAAYWESHNACQARQYSAGLSRVLAYATKHKLNSFVLMQYTKWRSIRLAAAFGRRGYWTHYLCYVRIGLPKLQPPAGYVPILATPDEHPYPNGTCWAKQLPYNAFPGKDQSQTSSHKKSKWASSALALRWDSG